MSAYRRRLDRRSSRGFTLVELLVATAAGLLVAIGAYTLAGGAMRQFQNESRISAAQLSAVIGINRLSADLQRAGFMASPNLPADPKACGAPALLTTGAFTMRALAVTQGGSAAAAAQSSETTENNLNPDSIDLVGNFHSSEQFPVAAINDTDPTAIVISLQTRSGPMYRQLSNLLANGGVTAQFQAEMARVFAPGRLIRLVDDVGFDGYGVVNTVTVSGGGGGNPPNRIDLTLNNVISLPSRTNNVTCGYTGFGTGLVVNPVSFMRYQLRGVAGTAYGALAATGPEAGLTGDAGRVELVRVERSIDNALAPTGDLPGTLELISEYAVDLKFGLTAECEGGVATPTCITPSANPRLVDLPITYNPEDTTVNMPAPPAVSAIAPQRVRKVQVRFSTRTRAPDRRARLVADGTDGRRTRLFIPGILGTGERYNWARMRTLYADVALQNLNGVDW